MVESWPDAAAAYNRQSLEQRDGYRGLILLPVAHLETILGLGFNSLPDEILSDLTLMDAPHPEDVNEVFTGDDYRAGLHQGEGFILGEPHLVNRGDSYLCIISLKNG